MTVTKRTITPEPYDVYETMGELVLMYEDGTVYDRQPVKLTSKHEFGKYTVQEWVRFRRARRRDKSGVCNTAVLKTSIIPDQVVDIHINRNIGVYISPGVQPQLQTWHMKVPRTDHI